MAEYADWTHRTSGPYWVLRIEDGEWVIAHWEYSEGPAGWTQILNETGSVPVTDAAFSDIDEEQIRKT